MSRADRAKQFMPFAALRGYDQVVKERERIVCEKEDLAEERIEQLSKTVSVLKKGDMVKAKYYKIDAYETISGVVTVIDTTMRYLKVIKTLIPFDDLYQIEIIE